MINNRTLFSRVMLNKNAKKFALPPKQTLEAPKPTKATSAKKSKQLSQIHDTSAGPQVVFVNVESGKISEKKESFTNEPEAEAVIDYYTAYFQTSTEYEPGTTLVMSSAFRT